MSELTPELIKALTQQTAPRNKPSDYSSTTLIRPPLMTHLGRKYGWKEKPLEESLAALYGTAFHAWMEQYTAPPSYCEVDVMTELDSTLLSGQIDLVNIEENAIKDYKLTKTWTVAKALEDGTKREWEEQLNIYRYLLAYNNIENSLPDKRYWVEKLQIIALVKDYGRYAKDKGIGMFEVIDLPVWSTVDVQNFILDKIRLHNAAKETLPRECTPAEKWQKVHYKLIVKGKKGRKNYQSLDEVTDKLLELGKPTDYEILTVTSEPLRCKSYCDFNHVCPYYLNTEELT